MPDPAAYSNFPGAPRLHRGLAELRANAPQADGLLLLVAAPRLRALGFEIPECVPSIADPEAALYAFLQAQHGDAAHREFNAMRHDIVSFANACDHS